MEACRRSEAGSDSRARSMGSKGLVGCTCNALAGYHGIKAQGSAACGGSGESGQTSRMKGTVQQCTRGIETSGAQSETAASSVSWSLNRR